VTTVDEPVVKKLLGSWLRLVKTVPRLSVADGSTQLMLVPVVPKGTVTVMSSPGFTITGGSISTRVTVTVKVQEAWLPNLSWKVYVTWVGPCGKRSPELWVAVVVNVLASVTTGSVQTAVAPCGTVVVSEMSFGQLMIVGGSMSTIW
jgi:hypothetical protein